MRRSSCLLLALLVLGVLLLGLDRAAVWASERLARSGAASLGAEGAQVDVRGFPFLTQLVTGDLDRVSFSARAATSDGVRLQDVVGDLREVRPTSWSSARAGSLAVAGTVPFAEMEERAELSPGALSAGPSADGGGPAVQVRDTVELLGQDVQVLVVADVTIDGAELVVVPREVEVDGADVGESLLDVVRERFTQRVAGPALPSGVTLSAVRVVEGGLRVDATGTDVELSRDG